jgi:hypothetical protein
VVQWKQALILAAALALGGCSAQAVGTVQPANPATPTSADRSVAPAATEAPATPTPAPTAVPTPKGPVTYQVGDAVTVTQNGSDWAKVTISDAAVVSSYKGSYGADKPKVAGNVFIQAKVTYESLTDGVDYNPFDWQVFCAGEAVENFSFVMYGPEPALHSGTLPNGRKASGFVVYEVAPKGEVRMSYKGNMFSNDGPLFEVIIRAA